MSFEKEISGLKDKIEEDYEDKIQQQELKIQELEDEIREIKLKNSLNGDLILQSKEYKELMEKFNELSVKYESEANVEG